MTHKGPVYKKVILVAFAKNATNDGGYSRRNH